MRLVQFTEVPVGAKLGQSIYGPTGRTLLNAGVTLDRNYLEMLAERRTQSLWLEDPDTSDVPFPEPISAELRARVTASVGGAFTEMTERTEGLRDSYAAVARKEMPSARLADSIKSVVGNGGLQAIARDMDGMLDELKGTQVLTGLNSIKSHDSYTFQHSIDVTIMGLVLAREMNWERWRLRAFGMGCMLHDMGKLFIDPVLLNKPAKLTDDEYVLFKAHPTVGYEAIKAFAEHLGVLAPHVAYQHHERQDGKGYPRGLRGTNTLGHNDKGKIHDFGAIAAVADVYDAMTSRRSYREGWTPARTIAMIQADAGTHFNRQAVDILLATVPLYPVYSGVRAVNGKYAGYRGIVADVVRLELNRPTIRLMYDPTGTRVEPIQIDLRVERDIGIEAIATDAVAAPPTTASARAAA